ncbi:MAG TPA: hypothetical protein VJ251_18280 [Stellaceae bacterium]|nr:hypothetical protein [Stellaceae bacterium]
MRLTLAVFSKHSILEVDEKETTFSLLGFLDALIKHRVTGF